MNENSTRDYLIWTREDPNHPRLVIARALRSLPLEPVDAVVGRTDRWLRTLDPAVYDWVVDALDADGGLADAAVRASRGGWATRLYGWRDLSPLVYGAEDHCPGWFTGTN